LATENTEFFSHEGTKTQRRIGRRLCRLTLIPSTLRQSSVQASSGQVTQISFLIFYSWEWNLGGLAVNFERKDK